MASFGNLARSFLTLNRPERTRSRTNAKKIRLIQAQSQSTTSDIYLVAL
jgi:hypothetical protein